MSNENHAKQRFKIEWTLSLSQMKRLFDDYLICEETNNLPPPYKI